ncbi:MAG: hypothetical protein P1U34_07525 [Coxiellaceae bacterium]|nr:hypothetical protein [Coxiellaceae bacterium]
MRRLTKQPSEYETAELTALLSGSELVTSNLVALEECLGGVARTDHAMMVEDRFKCIVDALSRVATALDQPRVAFETKYRQVLIGNIFVSLSYIFQCEEAAALPEVFNDQLNGALVGLFSHFLEIYHSYEPEEDLKVLNAVLHLAAAKYRLDVITTVDTEKLRPLVAACSPHMPAKQNQYVQQLVSLLPAVVVGREQRYAASVLIRAHGVLRSPSPQGEPHPLACSPASLVSPYDGDAIAEDPPGLVGSMM